MGKELASEGEERLKRGGHEGYCHGIKMPAVNLILINERKKEGGF